MKKSILTTENLCPMCGEGKTYNRKMDFKLKDENGDEFIVPNIDVEACGFCGEQILIWKQCVKRDKFMVYRVRF